MNGVQKKQGALKIKELGTRKFETATIRAARAASTCLSLRMEERAASETNRLTRNFSI
jgi:hypothetical protein